MANNYKSDYENRYKNTEHDYTRLKTTIKQLKTTRND